MIGVQFFKVANLNRNLTQFRPSEIHYLRDPTAQNGSLDIDKQKCEGLISSAF